MRTYKSLVGNTHVVLMPDEGAAEMLRDGTEYKHRLNLRSTWVKKQYYNYQRKHGIPEIVGLSADQRKEFEAACLSYIAYHYEQAYNTRLTYPCTPAQREAVDKICFDL